MIQSATRPGGGWEIVAEISTFRPCHGSIAPLYPEVETRMPYRIPGGLRMLIRPQAVLAALVLTALAAAPAATAQTRPGVGYHPQASGLTVPRYEREQLGSPFPSFSI